MGFPKYPLKKQYCVVAGTKIAAIAPGPGHLQRYRGSFLRILTSHSIMEREWISLIVQLPITPVFMIPRLSNWSSMRWKSRGVPQSC